jgi:hypothetical protein
MTIAAERALPREGIGAEILARQGADTLHFAAITRDRRRPRRTCRRVGSGTLGGGPAAGQSRRWDLRSPEFGGKPFFEGEVEPCINGGVLALGG